MPKSSESTQRKFISACSLVFILSITALVLFNNLVEDILHSTTKLTLNEIAVQQQLIINMDVEDAKNNIVSVAESLSSLAYTSSTLREYLVRQIENFSLEELAFIDLEGNKISAYGRHGDINTLVHLKDPHRKEATTSQPYRCAYSNNRVMDIASPVYENKTMVGLVVAKYSFALLTFNLNSIIQGNGYALISEGFENPAFTTSENYYTLSALKKAHFKDGETIENVMKNIKMKRDGIFSFEINYNNYIAIYKPLDINDWYFVLVLDEDKATASTKLFANIIALISIVVLSVLAFFLWYALHSKVQSIKAIEKVAYYDELTGLPNITYFKKHVSKVVKDNPHHAFAMIKIDIANFKTINEMFNYEVGNKVLHAFAKTGSLAPEKTFILARIVADEFIMFSGNGFLENLDSMTQFYEDYFLKEIPELGNHILNFSYGRYRIEVGETDVNAMINKTTIAHTMAKNNRGKTKGSYIWDYDDNYKKDIINKTAISNKMKQALQNKEFVPYFQAKFSLPDEKMIGAEALVRWVESDGTVVQPGAFIPLFESNGFIEELDMYVLERTCNTIKNWISCGFESVPISVNFSRIHLKNKNFIDSIIKIVDSYDIPHNLIEIELTESTVLDNEEVLKKLLDDLYYADFLVSIDDFGAGYSSLGLLKNFKIHTIKLDRSFFLDETTDERGELVVEGIIKLAHTLNIKVVAEGIEEQKQVDFLTKVKCETVQGFHYARPLPIEDFTSQYFQS